MAWKLEPKPELGPEPNLSEVGIGLELVSQHRYKVS
jgi:hypothetical protein